MIYTELHLHEKVIEKRCQASLGKSFKPIGPIVKYKKMHVVGMCLLQKPSQGFESSHHPVHFGLVLIQTKLHFHHVMVTFFWDAAENFHVLSMVRPVSVSRCSQRSWRCPGCRQSPACPCHRRHRPCCLGTLGKPLGHRPRSHTLPAPRPLPPHLM